ncbi:MAG: lysophospholipid acyltransferase family protein [Bryobacteraceae bacterium]
MIDRLRAYLISDPLIVLSTIFFGSISIAVSFFDKSGDTAIKVARAWARSLLLVSGVRVTVEGLEHIASDGSYVFISNHLSYMDTPVVLANIPVQFRFLAKRGLFQIPFLGTHLGQAGHVPVPREDPRASVKTMQTAAEIVQKRGTSMLVFPEGGRSRDGNLGEFKDGAAYIAIRAGVPVVPVAIVGTEKVLPFGSGTPKPGAVKLRIMCPIATEGRNLKERRHLTEHVRNVIAEAIERAETSG